LDSSSSDCFSEFVNTFSIFLKKISYRRAVNFLLQDWKEYKGIKHDIYFISCFDELRLLKNLQEEKSLQNVLELIKNMSDDPIFLFVFTALDPSVFNVGLDISQSGSSRYLDWKLPARMSEENMKTISSKLNLELDEKKNLSRALLLTDGHYRSVETVNIYPFFF
jgi:hypothetical protein